MFAAPEHDDVEYELAEVWDGTKWHVVHKMVPKKTGAGEDLASYFIHDRLLCLSISLYRCFLLYFCRCVR